MLAKCGFWVPMTDPFGVEGTLLLDTVELPGPYKARVASLRRLIESLDFEIELFTKLVRGRLAKDRYLKCECLYDAWHFRQLLLAE